MQKVSNMKQLYETRISDGRWIAYDLPGNVGWITYFVVLILCFIKRLEFMRFSVMRGIVIAAILPALLMLIGIVELIHERIKNQDRILPRLQVLLGFGALTFGGSLGAVISLAGSIYGNITGLSDITLIYILFCGAVLCAVFAGLLYKGYRPKETKDENNKHR